MSSEAKTSRKIFYVSVILVSLLLSTFIYAATQTTNVKIIPIKPSNSDDVLFNCTGTKDAGDQISFDWTVFKDNKTEFKEEGRVIGTLTGPYSAEIIDFDNDGDMDFVSAIAGSDLIVWYENDGSENFNMHTISSMMNGPHGATVGDLDGDGDLDVVSYSYMDDTIAWHRDNGPGYDDIVINSSTDSPIDIELSDLDDDGDIDIVANSEYDRVVAWYENIDGLGTFNYREIFYSLEHKEDSEVVDLDGDGDKDIVGGSWDAEALSWYENDGFESFTKRIIPVQYARAANSVDVCDLDGDGNIDIVGSMYQFNNNSYNWFENDGTQTFTEHMINLSEGTGDVVCEDIDGDGDFDIVASGYSSEDLIWYENDGSGHFTETFLNHSLVDPRYYDIGDIDSDGDYDILCPAFYKQSFILYENNLAYDTGSTSYGSDTEQTVYTLDSALTDNGDTFYHRCRTNISDGEFGKYISSVRTQIGNYAETISAFIRPERPEIDEDLTFNCTGDKNVAEDIAFDWVVYNDTEDVFNDTGNYIDNNADGASSLDSADIDGDGDMDILATNHDADTILWYENDGTGTYPERIINSTQYKAGYVYAEDIDDDGDVDVLTTSFQGDYIGIYKNDGTGNFGNIIFINESIDGPEMVNTADIDGDGDKDIVGISWHEDIVFWHENVGNGNFGDQIIITGPLDQPASAYPGDADGDGDIDIFWASWSDDEVAWHENDGNGNFIAKHLLTSSEPSAYHPVPSDMDGDGDLDVVLLSSSKIRLYENDGTGSFLAPYDIEPSGNALWHLYVGDIDGDSDNDVLYFSYNSTGIPYLAWYENDGNANFGSRQLIDNASIPMEAVYTEDLDGDGDMEAIYASLTRDKILYYDNNLAYDAGSTAYSQEKNQQVYTLPSSSTTRGEVYYHRCMAKSSGGGIGSYVSSPRTLVGAIINTTNATISPQDPKNSDSLTFSCEGDKPDMYQIAFDWVIYNHTDDAFSGSNQIDSNADAAWDVYAEDLDGDGDVDILGASHDDNTFAWHENDGSQSFTKRVINSTSQDARSIHPADIDGDGDMDVVTASYDDNTIAWYENDGSENFNIHILNDSSYGVWYVYPKDIDGDGDMDILSASDTDYTIAWYENDGSENFNIHVLDDTVHWASSVHAKDIDSDGDMDIIGNSAFDNKIYWYENDGSQSFTSHTIATSALGVFEVSSDDIDGDGDIDVVAALHDEDTIAWYENDGSETFQRHDINSSSDSVEFIHLSDMDGDGDIDILSSSYGDNVVAWYENNGTGSFSFNLIDVSAAYDPRGVFAEDMDGDGDIDAIASLSDVDSFVWYENNLAYDNGNTTFSDLKTRTVKTVSSTETSSGETWYHKCRARDDHGGIAEPYSGLNVTIMVSGLDNGQPCSLDSECKSGFCVDGVCCEGPCAGTCQICNDTYGGINGTCNNFTGLIDPYDECSEYNLCTYGDCDYQNYTGMCSDGLANCHSVIYNCPAGTACNDTSGLCENDVYCNKNGDCNANDWYTLGFQCDAGNCNHASYEDRDDNQSYCVSSEGTCDAHDWMGSYCCGDDAGEELVYRKADISMDVGYTTDPSDEQCCGTDECVDSSICYPSSSVQASVDFDLDDDYCNSSGYWVDCDDSSQCLPGFACVSGDCISNLQCTEYCTNITRNLCYAGCDGSNGCFYSDNTAALKCQGKPPGTLVNYDVGRYVECCEGVPTEGYMPSITYVGREPLVLYAGETKEVAFSLRNPNDINLDLDIEMITSSELRYWVSFTSKNNPSSLRSSITLGPYERKYVVFRLYGGKAGDYTGSDNLKLRFRSPLLKQSAMNEIDVRVTPIGGSNPLSRDVPGMGMISLIVLSVLAAFINLKSNSNKSVS